MFTTNKRLLCCKEALNHGSEFKILWDRDYFDCSLNPELCKFLLTMVCKEIPVQKPEASEFSSPACGCLMGK